MMAWLLCCLLNAAQGQEQEQAVRLDDINLMLGSQPTTRQTILEKMRSFHQAHAIALSVTLLPEHDVYQAFSMTEQTRWLGQSSPALAITIWHDAKFRTYQRCQVQVNTALSKRLPPATAQTIVSAQLRAGSQSSPARDEAMRQGLLGGLEELAAYLQALPAPAAMPAITFASAEVINTSPATGLDIFTHQAHQSNYEQVEVQGKPYPVAWKALRSGRSETVLAQVDDSLSFPAAVVFEQNGSLLPAQPASAHHQQQLLLTGRAQEQQGSVEVYGSQDKDAPLLGRLNTISYDALPKKLVLVPVMKTWMAYELQDIGQQVAAIYAQAAVDMTIAYQREPLMIDGWDEDHLLEDGTTGLLSNYTKEMRQVIKAYIKTHDTDKETAYIFIYPKPKSGEAKLGYMPKKRSYGFVFSQFRSRIQIAQAIAHELGHGLFRLEHSFETYPSLSKGSTDNLMDYQDGTRLHKYQWDLIHNPIAMLGWFQDEEESAFSIPCYGIFDDCDDVLKMLENVRNLRTNNKELLVKSPSEKEIIYTAYNVTIGGVDYKQIRVAITKNKTVHNPVKIFDYEDYDQEFLLADGSLDHQVGFAFKKEGKILAKILVNDHHTVLDNKQQSLRKYLFGEKEEAILAAIENIFKNNELKPDKIKEVRENIVQLDSKDKKAELYKELQKKVKYRDQRDNESPATTEDITNNSWMTTYNITTAGDIMCNLNSQAMCLEYLGVKPSCGGCSSSCNSYTQFEDYLECVRVDKGFDHRTKSSTREDLANLFEGVSFTFVSLETSDRLVVESKLKSYLKDGCSVLLSVFGHIVRLQDITDDGLIVDDPYGKVVSFSSSGVTPKYKKNNQDYRNGKDFTTTEGNDNTWSWSDIANYVTIKYAEVYCAE